MSVSATFSKTLEANLLTTNVKWDIVASKTHHFSICSVGKAKLICLTHSPIRGPTRLWLEIQSLKMEYVCCRGVSATFKIRGILTRFLHKIGCVCRAKIS
jgi:hypothetical protein